MSVADLCREYGVLRPTGYRWIIRYNKTGRMSTGGYCSKQHALPSRYIEGSVSPHALNMHSSGLECSPSRRSMRRRRNRWMKPENLVVRIDAMLGVLRDTIRSLDNTAVLTVEHILPARIKSRSTKTPAPGSHSFDVADSFGHGSLV